MRNAQDNAAHTCSYSCDRPECIKAQRDELAAAAAQEETDEVININGRSGFETHWLAGLAKIGDLLYAAPVTAAPGIDLATAWAEGYRSGVTDERISESNIGIAGFGAKIEPSRANPYMIDASHKGGSCATCNGNGMIGGLLPAGGGYESEPCSDCSPKGGSEAAWDDCKVAFGFDGDEEAIWDAWKRGKLSLPPGWSFSETDGAGARMVAVFRVDGIPAPKDGETVRELLNMLAQAQAGDAEVQP